MAKGNEFYSRNNRGLVRCRLCDTVHRDEENFIVHLSAKRHVSNLERLQAARQQVRSQQQDKERLVQQSVNSTHKAPRPAVDPRTASKPSGPRVGKPVVTYRLEPDAQLKICRVWFNIDYPHVDETCRPLHRWISTYEQHVEPQDERWKYLLFACDPYDTVSYKFPAQIPVATADTHPNDKSHYSCEWDAVQRRYSLFFVVG